MGHVERSMTIEPSYLTLRRLTEEPTLLDIVPPEAVKSFSTAMGHYVLRDCEGLWYEPDARSGHCEPNKLVVDIGTRIAALCDLYNSDAIQSPIEHMLVGALLWLDIDWAGLPKTTDFYEHEHRKFNDGHNALRYWITPQAQVAGWKVDFLIWMKLGSAIGGVAIECDGHDFHERTKEQASRDKKRDRDILSAGYPVMRFTGSEIFRDPIGCAEQLREHLSDILYRVSKEGGLF